MKKTKKTLNKVIFILSFLQLYKNVLLYTHIFMTETFLLYLTKTGIDTNNYDSYRYNLL